MNIIKIQAYSYCYPHYESENIVWPVTKNFGFILAELNWTQNDKAVFLPQNTSGSKKIKH